jgi:hypothetical protein
MSDFRCGKRLMTGRLRRGPVSTQILCFSGINEQTTPSSECADHSDQWCWPFSNIDEELRREMSRVIFLSIATAIIVLFLSAGTCDAREPVIARGAYRQKIRSTPIVHRPNRPLHFYGNTVRRMHHRRSRSGW